MSFDDQRVDLTLKAERENTFLSRCIQFFQSRLIEWNKMQILMFRIADPCRRPRKGRRHCLVVRLRSFRGWAQFLRYAESLQALLPCEVYFRVHCRATREAYYFTSCVKHTRFRSKKRAEGRVLLAA